MNSAVKIIKRGQNKISTEDLASRDEKTGAESTREIVETVKGWISELQQRHGEDKSGAERTLRRFLSMGWRVRTVWDRAF